MRAAQARKEETTKQAMCETVTVAVQIPGLGEAFSLLLPHDIT